MVLKQEIIVIFSTAPPDKSESLARMLVCRRLVACVNVVPVCSFYTWKGAFCKEPEHLLIAKTSKDRSEEVIAALKAIHPNDVPEIITLPVTGGHLPYLEWVLEETRDSL